MPTCRGQPAPKGNEPACGRRRPLRNAVASSDTRIPPTNTFLWATFYLSQTDTERRACVCAGTSLTSLEIPMMGYPRGGSTCPFPVFHFSAARHECSAWQSEYCLRTPKGR
ncbi:hypothetical protein J6590_032627 [Homalodisca vitripennis]|nr:hypothetical protein J6590_032627 [Homalodisca vitripennis]